MSYLYGGINSVAIGPYAGSTLQSTSAIAIGYSAGTIKQGDNAISIGAYAGSTLQSTSAVAIGNFAGQTNQGLNAIAIGAYAGKTNQPTNSIVLNATGTALSGSAPNACYIAPLRNIGASTMMLYDSVNNEVVYSNSLNATITANGLNYSTLLGSTNTVTSTITGSLFYSTLIGSTINSNTHITNSLSFSSLVGSTITTTTQNVLSCTYSTMFGSTLTASTLNASTMNTSTIVFSDGKTQNSSALGYGQIYRTYTSATRAFGTTYTNTTGRPIYVSIVVSFQGATVQGTGYANALVNAVAITYNQVFIPANATILVPIYFIIPAGGTYIVYAANSVTGGSNATITLYTWAELS